MSETEQQIGTQPIDSNNHSGENQAKTGLSESLLAEALRVFADAAPSGDGTGFMEVHDSAPIKFSMTDSGYKIDLTVGDLRRARAALNPPKITGGE